MTRKEIMDNYAKEQGYQNWEHLLISIQNYCSYKESADSINIHFNNITDLIQIELKERIKNSYYENYHADFESLIDVLVPIVE